MFFSMFYFVYVEDLDPRGTRGSSEETWMCDDFVIEWISIYLQSWLNCSLLNIFKTWKERWFYREICSRFLRVTSIRPGTVITAAEQVTHRYWKKYHCFDKETEGISCFCVQDKYILFYTVIFLTLDNFIKHSSTLGFEKFFHSLHFDKFYSFIVSLKVLGQINFVFVYCCFKL